jgi:hypothetical protein
MDITDYKHGDIVHMNGFGEGVIIYKEDTTYVSFDSYGNKPFKLALFDLDDMKIIRHYWERGY